MAERITGRLPDGTAYVRSETGKEGVGYHTTQRRLPEIVTKLAKLEDKIENGDLVEVVHSKWIKRNNERRCPICGFFYLTNGMTVYKFCPMCGAKMDGDKNG